jgi:hypothetical protein
MIMLSAKAIPENKEVNDQPRSIAMQGRDIQVSEKECISQCILKFWSDSDPQSESHDERYEQCLTDCDVCGSN